MKRIIDVDENLVCEGFVRNFTEEEKDVLITAIRNSIPYEPKGEWVVIHNALGETKYQCNRCQHFVKPGDDKNFCPNCGAKMGENKMTGYNELRDGQEFYGNGYKKGYEDAKKEYARPQDDWRDNLIEVFRQSAEVGGDTFHLFEIERIINGEPI